MTEGMADGAVVCPDTRIIGPDGDETKSAVVPEVGSERHGRDLDA